MRTPLPLRPLRWSSNLLCGLRKHLRPKGRMFVCGPAAGTNQELLELAAELGPDAIARFSPVGDFLTPTL